MIKVFFDHQKFSTQRFGGISRYFATIIDEISRHSDFDFKLGVLYSDNHYIKVQHGELLNKIARKILHSEYGSRISRLNQAYCQYLLSRGEFDVFHPTYYDNYYLPRLKKPMVTTIHDMTHERLPEYFWSMSPLTAQKRINIEKADHIIAISETTKKDLIELSGVEEKKISVIYHGIDLDTDLVYEEVPDMPDSFLLFVGDRSGYKNFYIFIDAFERLTKRYTDLHLILCGGGTLGIADQELIKHKKLEKKITHLNVSDGQLNTLYKKAIIFVYPSLYEGFGLPILEAFKARCPIILSDIECFKEVAGGAALYFSKHNLDDLTEKLIYAIDHPSFRERLVKSGLERIKLFPLGKSMEKTLDLYKKVV